MKKIVTLVFASLITAFVTPVHAQNCIIADPSDTSLNVRETPNGKVINRLRNGRKVVIQSKRNDAKGRPWGYATGLYKGRNRNWGWVFMQSVNCGRVAQRSVSGGKKCVINDITDTSLNVRERPNGKVINRLRNGRQVSIIKTSNDSKGRPWGYAVGQYKGQNRNWGWVFMEGVQCGGSRQTARKSKGEFDSRIKDFWRAERILKKRGFNNQARISALQGVIFQQYSATEVAYEGRGGRWSKTAERLVKEYARRFGTEANVVVYTDYSPDTGRAIMRKSFTEMARTISQCFSRARPWRDCKLNYHPVDGCFLTKQQRKICSKPSGSSWQQQCWNYEKGPGIQLPYQAAQKSQIKLAKVEVKKRAAVAKKAKKRVINPRGRPVCKHAYANGPVCLSSAAGC